MWSKNTDIQELYYRTYIKPNLVDDGMKADTYGDLAKSNQYQKQQYLLRDLVMLSVPYGLVQWSTHSLYTVTPIQLFD